ncbi:hypothetical protein CHN50_18215 [Priestia aryabhattai]|nr:hypothetical protein CHN50_18215 [Priestia aryabhattai]
MGTNKQYKNNAKKQKGEVFFIEGFSFFYGGLYEGWISDLYAASVENEIPCSFLLCSEIPLYQGFEGIFKL